MLSNITWDKRSPHAPISSQYIFPPASSVTDSKPRKLKKRVSFATSVKSDVSGKTDATAVTDGSDAGGESSLKTKSKWSFGGKKKAQEDSEVVDGDVGQLELGHTDGSSPKSPKEGGWLSRFWSTRHKKHSAIEIHHGEDEQHDVEDEQHTASAQAASAETSNWHHHDRYFPVFSDKDIFGPSPAPASATAAAYTFSSPFENAMTPMELQAIEHSKMSGRPVIVHYPDLPAFQDYLQGKKPEAIGWNSARWGTDGWTGYGWGGEVLPDKEGKTFGVAMPEGKPSVGADGGGAKKKKGKGGDGEDGGEEGEGGDGDGEGGEAEGGGEGGATDDKGDGTGGDAPASGGGGGGKNKKKKKK